MKKENINIWENLVFKTEVYHRNSDLIMRDENIVTDAEGKISLLRLATKETPLIVGKYTYSIWNIKLGELLDADIERILESYAVEDAHKDLYECYMSQKVDFKNIEKVVVLKTMALHPDIRNKGVTEEYFEMIFKQYYNDKTLILGYFKPLQNIEHNDAYDGQKQYYGINKFDDDFESNELKLFALASRCGFNRIAETNLFIFNPFTIMKRLLLKSQLTKDNNLENQLKNDT